MRRLICRRDQERGAVAVIVAVVVSTLVLTGVAALSVDAGNIYAERRVLQNGVDAASLALAQICAKDINDPMCAKTSALNGYLQGLAVANASIDQPPSIYEVCGGGPAADKFGSCDDSAEDPETTVTGCLPLSTSPLPANVNWVQVKARYFVPSVFAGLKKGSIYKGTVQACARAAWGPATSGPSTIPMTISKCEWDRNYSPSTIPPPYSSTFLTSQQAKAQQKTLYFHDTTGANPCPPHTPSGFDLPGGFGYLATNPSDACEVAVKPDLWYDTSTGNGYSSLNCNFRDFVGQIVYVPIFVQTNGLTGNNLKYKLDGVAAFFVTGYRVSGNDPKVNVASIVTNNYPGCTPSQTCLFGWFTQGYMPASEFLSGGGGGGGTARGANGVGVFG